MLPRPAVAARVTNVWDLTVLVLTVVGLGRGLQPQESCMGDNRGAEVDEVCIANSRLRVFLVLSPPEQGAGCASGAFVEWDFISKHLQLLLVPRILAGAPQYITQYRSNEMSGLSRPMWVRAVVTSEAHP